jgi:hypothetical protein
MRVESGTTLSISIFLLIGFLSSTADGPISEIAQGNVYGRSVRPSLVQPVRSESAVSVQAKSTPTNDRSGDIGRTAATSVPRMRADAASATCSNSNVGKVPRLTCSSALQQRVVHPRPVVRGRRG